MAGFAVNAEKERTAVVFAATEPAVNAKGAVDAPAETVTVAGTGSATASLLVTATTKPPAGAGPVRATVPDKVAAGAREVLETVTFESCTATTTTVAFIVTPPAENERTAVVFEVAEPAVNAKDAVDAPAGTVTLAGTGTAAELLLVTATATPPAGASRVAHVSTPSSLASPIP